MVTQHASRPKHKGISGLFGTTRRVFTLLFSMMETRLRLAILELEEEKQHLLHLLLLAGVTLLLTATAVVTLVVLLFLLIPVEQRLLALGVITVVLFLLAGAMAIVTLRQTRRSTLLTATREQLHLDRKALEKNNP